MTVGERAEDVFYITDSEHHPLEADAAQRLKDRLSQALAGRQAA
jgi:UTP:GlnB (protein PII) uridylyltransferase